MSRLFEEPVVRRFVRDQDVMRVALGHTGVRDPDKPGLLVHIGDRGGARVAHRRLQATYGAGR